MPRQTYGECFDGREQALLQSDDEESGSRAPSCCRGTKALFAQVAVVVQQARKDKLRCVLWETVDDHRFHNAHWESANFRPDVFLETAHHHRIQIRSALYLDATRETVRIEQFQERREAVGVPVVGGGGQEQTVFEAIAKVPHRPRELGLDTVAAPVTGCGVVCLVQHEDAPGPHCTEPRPHGLGVSRVGQQSVGDEEAAVRRPWVGTEAAFAPNARQVLAVQNLEDQPEPLLHLGLPLFQHRRGGSYDDRGGLCGAGGVRG